MLQLKNNNNNKAARVEKAEGFYQIHQVVELCLVHTLFGAQ